jgi:hypothetical protein
MTKNCCFFLKKKAHQVALALTAVQIRLGHISGAAEGAGRQLRRLLALLVGRTLLPDDGLDLLPVFRVDFAPVFCRAGKQRAECVNLYLGI